TLENEDGHTSDIRKYVLKKLRKGKGKNEMEAVVEKIVQKASGIFIWVVLVIPMLNEAYDHGQLRALEARLSELPKKLDRLFEEILLRDEKNVDHLRLCL